MEREVEKPTKGSRNKRNVIFPFQMQLLFITRITRMKRASISSSFLSLIPIFLLSHPHLSSLSSSSFLPLLSLSLSVFFTPSLDLGQIRCRTQWNRIRKERRSKRKRKRKEETERERKEKLKEKERQKKRMERSSWMNYYEWTARDTFSFERKRNKQSHSIPLLFNMSPSYTYSQPWTNSTFFHPFFCIFSPFFHPIFSFPFV